jgi:hypothetical protein
MVDITTTKSNIDDHPRHNSPQSRSLHDRTNSASIRPMELTSEQKKAVTDWVAKGDGLSEVQRKLASEFNITMTFMDVRFLVDDLGATLKNKQTAQPKAIPASPNDDLTTGAAAGAPADEEAVEDLPPPAADGVISNVKIDIDVIMKPGAIVSGTVVFSDGVKASWSLDTSGRLALSASKEGYRPGPDDVRAFQQELTKQLQKRGF